MSNETTVQNNYAAFGRGDVAAILQSMTPTVEWLARYPSVVPFSGLHRGPEGIINLFKSIGSSLEVLRFEISKFHVAPSSVLVEGEEEVRVRSNGRTYTNQWIHIWEFTEDGKVSRVSNYNDTDAAYKGFAP